uniref:Putative octopamine receptor n=1 Tax=Cupiennius salei TaxID=6928 RepID=T1D1U1_CUPSA
MSLEVVEMMIDNESMFNDTFLNNVSTSSLQDPPASLIGFILKTCAVILIIFTAIFGNILIILSVYRHHKLRITTNYFIVSLACADILVALFAMSFNATNTLYGRWVFNQGVCDFWNSCDVLFSTASIMHLCCISVDRYYAIVKPFEYPNKITSKSVACMLATVWLVSGLLSFIPIFSGWYTTNEHLLKRSINPDVCEFVVNKPYAVVSSCISFWVPCIIMISAYIRIYFEATKQEKMICKSSNIIPQYPRNSTDTTAQMVVHTNHHRNSHVEDDHNTPTKRNIVKMKREHKAAKTLGIIMGAFILCWLPFFIWYLTVSLCDSCHTPEIVVDILFWIGYFNSSLNPVIYAYFNTDFREAMKGTIMSYFCCCVASCRCNGCKKHYNQNNNIHFNCTYRSTQDIGLVENKCSRGNI